MKFACEKCGKVYLEEDYPKVGVCDCGGELDVAFNCEQCDKDFHINKLTNGLCDKCLKEWVNLDNILLFVKDKKLDYEWKELINEFIFGNAEMKEMFAKWIREWEKDVGLY